MASSSFFRDTKFLENNVAIAYNKNLFTEASLLTCAKQNQYATLQSLLLMYLDNLDGIESSIVVDKAFPTNVAMVRDARNALTLNKRKSPDDLELHAVNTVLRVLTTMRAVIYALAKTQNKNLIESLQIQFHKYFKYFTDRNFTEVENQERDFNSEIIITLHAANLIDDSFKDYPRLLLHYRDLACLLDVAKSLQTILIHQMDDRSILHYETAHPITEKTEEQLKQFAVIKPENELTLTEPPNFHNANQLPFRKANYLFKDLLMDNQRRLPAQARNNIAPTLKNPYIVKNELVFSTTIHGKQKAEFWSLRCGSMVYVGPGKEAENNGAYTSENLKQLLKSAQKFVPTTKTLHITMLLTDSIIDLEDSKLIVQTTDAERKNLQMNWSHIATNFLGSITNLPSISNIIFHQPVRQVFEAKKPRMDKAALVIKQCMQNPQIMNVTCCASGRDRTGTALEIATEYMIVNEYEKFRMVVSRETIENVRALGCHNAFLASFATPGATGMKIDSKPGNYFQDETNVYFYRETADRNKWVPINDKTLKEVFDFNQDENINFSLARPI